MADQDLVNRCYWSTENTWEAAQQAEASLKDLLLSVKPEKVYRLISIVDNGCPVCGSPRYVETKTALKDNWYCKACGRGSISKADYTCPICEKDSMGHHYSVESCSAPVCRVCFEIIEEYRSGEPGITPKALFDSDMELDYINMIKRHLPKYFIVPNASLGAFIDTNKANKILTPMEFDFMLKSRVDILVTSPNGYRPVLAVEIDSSYHDTESAAFRDSLKNKILKLAGIPLIRYRPSKEDEDDFIKAVDEQVG